MNLALTNKVVLITGANGGIGQAISSAFIAEGATLLAGYRGDVSKLDELKSMLNADQQNQVKPILLDLDDIAKCKVTIDEAADEFGAIEVLVNCAGTAIEKPFLLTEFDEIDKQTTANFSAPIKLTQLVLKHMMLNRKGSVINVSSVHGFRFGRGVAVYAANKSAIERFTQALALEVGRNGIRVNAVCPGMIETKMIQSLQKNMPPDILKRCPISRPGKPYEIANAVLFLASETMSSYITGTTLVVDGGISI
jgi:NAD(P)-dependent dehydrogenase (short-subunit alcohol dehydrogenase family)